jgi:hypothetical protein
MGNSICRLNFDQGKKNEIQPQLEKSVLERPGLERAS